jgi:hypothetical protein
MAECVQREAAVASIHRQTEISRPTSSDPDRALLRFLAPAIPCRSEPTPSSSEHQGVRSPAMSLRTVRSRLKTLRCGAWRRLVRRVRAQRTPAPLSRVLVGRWERSPLPRRTGGLTGGGGCRGVVRALHSRLFNDDDAADRSGDSERLQRGQALGEQQPGEDCSENGFDHPDDA